MKKVLLTAITLASIATSSAFGMYGDNSDWIDFLVNGNQLRAKMDQLGVTIGNGTIKGTFGLRGNTSGVIFDDSSEDIYQNKFYKLQPTISAGIGYTSPAFGIGVGYNYTMFSRDLGVHTPVLTINAMNDNLRIAIPVKVASASSLDKTIPTPTGGKNKDYMGVSTETQIRYYTGIDAFNLFRLYIKYGQSGYKHESLLNKTTEYAQSSFGFDARFYFLNTTVGNVGLNPFVKVTYDTALTGENIAVTAESVHTAKVADKKYDRLAYQVQAIAALGMSASSDIVSLYVEPSLGYKAKADAVEEGHRMTDVKHSLTWNAYGEIYITPVKDLEWYFEAEVGNADISPVKFNATTGITWYLPSFNNAQ